MHDQAYRLHSEEGPEPVHPVQSVQSAQSVQSVELVWSVQSVQSVQPAQSVPAQSVQPVHSVQAVQPVHPVQLVQPAPTSASFQVEQVLAEQVSGQQVLEDSAATSRVQCLDSTQFTDSEATVVHS